MNFKYVKKLYREIEPGSLFCICQEITNFGYFQKNKKYIPAYRKINDSKYESSFLVKDYRKNPTSQTPKIHGFLHKNAEVYHLLN